MYYYYYYTKFSVNAQIELFSPEVFELYFLDRYNPIYNKQMWKTRSKQYPDSESFTMHVWNSCAGVSSTFWGLGDSSRCCFDLCSFSVISLIFRFTCNTKKGLLWQRIYNEHLRFIQFSFEGAGRSLHASMNRHALAKHWKSPTGLDKCK